MRAPDTLLLATRSADKAREIRDILAATGRTIVSLDDAGFAPLPDEDDIEAFDSFVANAHAKAAYFRRRTGLPTIADDSGICVDALHGQPGVHSRRFAMSAGVAGIALDHANNARMLELLRAVPREQRTAHYTCAAVLHLTDDRRFTALGVRSGFILDQPRGSHGFGYDPLFLDPITGLSFGELDPDLKNRISHRARAFRALAGLL